MSPRQPNGSPTIDAAMVAHIAGQAADALDDARGALRVCETTLFDLGRDAGLTMAMDTGQSLIALSRSLATIARLLEWEGDAVDRLAEAAEAAIGEREQ